MYITRKQSIFLASVALGLFFLVGAYLVSRNQGGATLEGAEERAEGPDTRSTPGAPPAPGGTVVLDNFHRSETKGDKKLWEVEAVRGEYFPATNEAIVDSATIFFYREDDSTVTLKAPKAKLELQGPTLAKAEASGGVQMVYGNDFIAETSVAQYDKQAGSVTAPTRTVITGTAFKLEGDTLTIDTNSRSMTITGNVKTMYAPDKRPPNESEKKKLEKRKDG